MKNLAIGVHGGISNKDYHAAKEIVSKSHLDKVDRSPAHYKHWLHNGTEQTKAMLIGSAAHLAVLEPDEFEKEVVCVHASTRSTKIYKEAEEVNLGKIVLLQDEYSNVLRMRDIAMDHPLFKKILSGGKAEQTCIWKDQESGLTCKVRPDYLRDDGIVVDYKTTQDGSFKAFQRSVHNYRYDVQGGMYLSALSELRQQKLDKFVLIAQESVEPFAISIYVLDDATLEIGQKKMRRNLNTIAECRTKNEWPAYPSEFQMMNLPAYAWNEEE